MTEGKELPLGMTDISGNCVSFVSNHHVKTDLGVTVEISTMIKTPENISSLLHHFELISSFCISSLLSS